MRRVLRGGSWNNNPRNLRVSNRNRNTPDNRNDNNGFRCAREAGLVAVSPRQAGAPAITVAGGGRLPRPGRAPGAGPSPAPNISSPPGLAVAPRREPRPGGGSLDADALAARVPGGKGSFVKLRNAVLAGFLAAALPSSAAEPVLLLHGLWGTADSWKAYAGHLRSAGWAEGCVVEFAPSSAEPRLRPLAGAVSGGNVTGSAAWTPEAACASAPKGGRPFFRVVFGDNDGQSFETQGRQVAAAVAKVRGLTGAAKVALVGHSMGGLAARAYLQSPGYRNDVAAFATVATPHGGSLLPYLEAEPWKEDCPRVVRWVGGRKLEAPAVGMLAPDSPEMLALNRPESPNGLFPADVRVANLVAEYEARGDGTCSVSGMNDFLARWQAALAKHFDPARSLSLASGAVMANWTDGIVPAVSQLLHAVPAGYGLKPEVGVVKSFHSDAPDVADTWAFLDRFLAPAKGAKAEAAPLEVALVLDSSGSMQENDPGFLRREGARLLVDRCPAGTRFSLVRFASDAALLTRRSDDANEVKRGLSSVGASGGTRMCLGLGTALEALRSAEPGARKAAVLFTDGLSSDKCTAADLAQAGVTLFTVGLSKAADGATLQAMAAAGGGTYVHALTAADLQAVFDVVAAGILDEATLLDAAGRAAPGATARFRFPVDGSVGSLTGSVTWTGSDLDLALVSPTGRRHEARTGGVSAGSYESLRLDAPEKGEWQALVKSVDVPASGEPFRLRVTGDSPVRLSVEPVPADVQTGRPLELSARLDGFPSGAGRAEASVTRPDGRVVPVEAQLEGEIVRAAYRGVDKPGPYAVRFTATRGGVTRGALRTAFVGGAEIVSRVGEILRVEGSWAVWNRGEMHGMRPGLSVRLFRGGRPIGIARVVDVRMEESDLEIDEITGVPELRRGDGGEVDPADWTGEGR